jgi:hypothetical protein
MGEAHHRLVYVYHPPRLVGDLLHRALQRVVPGDGLGCISGALQREEVVLHLFFRLGLGTHVQRHHKARGSALVLNGLCNHAYGKERTVFAPVLRDQTFRGISEAKELTKMRLLCLGKQIGKRQRQKLLR